MSAKPASQPQSPPAPSNRRAAPIRTFRFGHIKAKVWENEVDDLKIYNVTFSRMYSDDKGAFHDSASFGRDDLLLVAKLADQAHTFICEHLAKLKEPQKE